jgi:uncharacterized protein
MGKVVSSLRGRMHLKRSSMKLSSHNPLYDRIHLSESTLHTPHVPIGGYMLGDGSTDWNKVLSVARTAAEKEHATQQHHAASRGLDHVDRVAVLAVSLAREERASALTTVRTALLAYAHDLRNRKLYPLLDDEGVVLDVNNVLIQVGVPIGEARRCADLVPWVSYTHECAHKNATESMRKHYPALAFVQSANRLDSTGALGLARAFAYTGKTRLYQPQGTTYFLGKNSLASARQHLEEQVLLVADSIPCESGRQRARVRHAYVTTFTAQFDEEMGSETIHPLAYITEECTALDTNKLDERRLQRLSGDLVCSDSDEDLGELALLTDSE